MWNNLLSRAGVFPWNSPIPSNLCLSKPPKRSQAVPNACSWHVLSKNSEQADNASPNVNSDGTEKPSAKAVWNCDQALPVQVLFVCEDVNPPKCLCPIC